jgi:hypothetical protein
MRAVSDARRAIDLASVRADGWFSRLGEDAREFRQLCQIVGERFVGFSIIAGIHIRALTLDRRTPDASLVDFSVGDSAIEQRLSLGEYRRRLATAMLSEEDTVDALPEEPEPDDLQAFLGVRTLMLAGLYGVELRSLRVGGGRPIGVVVGSGNSEAELTPDDLRESLRDCVRDELSRVLPQSPFAIDLARVPEAAEALASGDDERVIELLGAWPGPLSMLLRTSEGVALGADSRATLGDALGILGAAYTRTSRFDWADEVLRLGIQWAQDGAAGARLFRRLAEAHVARNRHGEAIGLLRRALALGAPSGEVLPTLARCFAARERWVAARLCVEEAEVAGVPAESLADVRHAAEAALGEAWTTLRATIAGPAVPVPTLPPPVGVGEAG